MDGLKTITKTSRGNGVLLLCRSVVFADAIARMTEVTHVHFAVHLVQIVVYSQGIQLSTRAHGGNRFLHRRGAVRHISVKRNTHDGAK